MAYEQPRTFGDLIRLNRCLHLSCRCSFCKNDAMTPGYKGARKYSTRHYICDECIEPRRDTVLPRVAKHDKFQARLAAIRAQQEDAHGQ